MSLHSVKIELPLIHKAERRRNMAQFNITLNFEEVKDLFTKSRDEAFADLMAKVLNAVLLAESDTQIGATKYERNEERQDYRNGTRPREYTTRLGKLRLEIPRHRNQPFHTMIFDNYQRSEAAFINTIVEMVVQGISTRKVEKVVEELCGQKISKSEVSNLCMKLDEAIEPFRNRKLSKEYPFVMVDATYLRVREEHTVVSKALMVAIGINLDGKKEVLGFESYDEERGSTWKSFLQGLKDRGLEEISLVTSDAHRGIIYGLSKVYPKVPWQRCQMHFVKNILDEIPKRKRGEVTIPLRKMFNAKSIEDAREIRDMVLTEYGGVYEKAMDILEEGFEDSMTVMHLPERYRVTLRTSNHLERANGIIKARSNVIKIFPNESSVVRLCGGVLYDLHNSWSMKSSLFPTKEIEKDVIEVRESLIQIARKQATMLQAI